MILRIAINLWGRKSQCTSIVYLLQCLYYIPSSSVCIEPCAIYHSPVTICSPVLDTVSVYSPVLYPILQCLYTTLCYIPSSSLYTTLFYIQCLYTALCYIPSSSVCIQPCAIYSAPGVDKFVGGHHFKTNSFTAARWCDVCGRFMWGLVRQGMKCKGRMRFTVCVWFKN